MGEFVETGLKLGDLDEDVPVRIEVTEGRPQSFWIVKRGSSIYAIENRCAHMGGQLELTDNGFVCTQHAWRYDLMGLNIETSNGDLRLARTTIATNGSILVARENGKDLFEPRLGDAIRPRILVHSHACLELIAGSNRILFDPWLTGNAYYGSWSLFPQPFSSVDSIDPTAIVVTHPHPDHFHPETLRHFNPEVPIYFPRFVSRHIEHGLREIGWKSIHSVRFEEAMDLDADIRLTFLQPTSMWDDSSTFVQIGKWTWLNQNDSGSVLNDDLLPESIDLLSSAFDQGASGYPLTWESIPWGRRRDMMRIAKTTTLTSLVERAKQLRATFFLPFAGHWRLSQPEHREFADAITHTTFDEIRHHFSEGHVDARVLPLYPGQGFDFQSCSRFGAKDEELIWKLDRSRLDDVVTDQTDEQLAAGLKRGLGELNDLGRRIAVERVEFTVEVDDSRVRVEQSFGDEEKLKQGPGLRVRARIPRRIAELLALGRANWDHVAIGYWARWSREPDVYPARFMRLLQQGIWRQEELPMSLDKSHFRQSIGTYIEKSPDTASRILNRAGLPCAACTKSNSESIQDAIRYHKLSPGLAKTLERELQALLED